MPTSRPCPRLPVRTGLSILALLLPGAGGEAAALDLNRIERWAGEGTNQAALVVDWHDGRRPHALAWGYRWNGTATGLDLWQAVTNGDPGLSGIVTNLGAALRLTGVEYRRPTRPGDLLPATGRHGLGGSAYAWDHTGTVVQTGTWSYWASDGAGSYDPSSMVAMTNSLADRVLANGSWDAWSFDPHGTSRPPGFAMGALHYPFATGVVDYAWGSGFVGFDPVDFAVSKVYVDYTNAAVALGRPTVDTTGDVYDLPLGDPVPAVPAYAPFRAFELVGVSGGGRLVLAFDHPVLDHPDNPYGVDLLLFGNPVQLLSGTVWTNGDPGHAVLAADVLADPGSVRVSQDGVTWFGFTNGPFADTFAPTLGRIYDPSAPVPGLFSSNAWWGGPTDPTVPVDPALVPESFDGFTVAEIAARYRGSAGGTGFDLAELDLPPDPDTGYRWIRYVEITRAGSLNPEIDAVADVSPAPPYRRWREATFPWLGDPADEADDADADGNGLPTLVDYALVGFITQAVADAATPMLTRPDNGGVRASYRVATAAVDVVVRPEGVASLINGGWSPTGLVPVAAGPAGPDGRPMAVDLPTSQTTGFLRLTVSHDE